MKRGFYFRKSVGCPDMSKGLKALTVCLAQKQEVNFCLSLVEQDYPDQRKEDTSSASQEYSEETFQYIPSLVSAFFFSLFYSAFLK